MSGEPRGTVEQIATLRIRTAAERRLEQLPDDPERPLALELGAACASHLESALVRLARRGTQETRLAESGCALVDQQGALTCAGAVEPHGEPIQLAFALQQ